MWWCFGCYFCLPVLFTVLCQMATRNVNSDSSPAQKQRSLDDRSSSHKRQQHQAVERQLNCTLLALAVVYGVCALPEHVCNITLAYTHIHVSEDTAAMLALLHHFLLFFKSSVTPVLLLCLCKVSRNNRENLEIARVAVYCNEIRQFVKSRCNIRFVHIECQRQDL